MFFLISQQTTNTYSSINCFGYTCTAVLGLPWSISDPSLSNMFMIFNPNEWSFIVSFNNKLLASLWHVDGAMSKVQQALNKPGTSADCVI